MSKQTKKSKRYSLRMTEDNSERIRQRAEALKMSVNHYLLYSTEQEMRRSVEATIPETEIAPQRLIIRLSDEQRDSISKRASAKGLSIRQYMDWLLNKRSDVDIRIAVTDLETVEKQINDLVTVFNGVASVIIRSGKVYEGELNTMLSAMHDINEYFKKLYREEHDNRYKLYAECRKRIFEEIDKASFIRRNRFETRE